MGCRKCGSENTVRLNAELVLTSAKLKSMLSSAPVYLVQKVVICFECGFAELKIPKDKLALLQKKKAA